MWIIEITLSKLELRERRQEGLNRSGAPFSTVRKFEQKGVIFLDSFLKLDGED